MKFLIMGATGFIGSAVFRLAIDKRYSVVSIDALTYAACLENLASVADGSIYVFEHAYIRDRAAGAGDQLLKQLRALPIPGKADLRGHAQRVARQASANLRR